MEFNKTKRNLELFTAVASSIISFILLSLCYGLFLSSWPTSEYRGLWIILFIYEIVQFVLCIFLSSYPLKKDGTLKSSRLGIRLALLILSILDGLLIRSILLIIILCMKDYNELNEQTNITENKVTTKLEKPTQKIEKKKNLKTNDNTLEWKIKELKKLRDLDVIDEESYQKAVKKITDDLLK